MSNDWLFVEQETKITISFHLLETDVVGSQDLESMLRVTKFMAVAHSENQFQRSLKLSFLYRVELIWNLFLIFVTCGLREKCSL